MSLERSVDIGGIASQLISTDACNGLRLGGDGLLYEDDRRATGFYSNRNINNITWNTDTDATNEVPYRSATITNPSTCNAGFAIIDIWHGKIWFRDTTNAGNLTIRYYPRFGHILSATPAATAPYDINYSIGYSHPNQSGMDVWSEFDAGYTKRIIPVPAGGSLSVTIGGLFTYARPPATVGNIQYYIRKESLSLMFVNS